MTIAPGAKVAHTRSMALARPPAALVYERHLPIAVAAVEGAAVASATGPATLATGSRVTLDFGEELVGTVRFTVETRGNSRLEVIEGEDLEEALLLQDPFPSDHWYHQPRDHFDLGPGRHETGTPGRRAFRFVTFCSHGPAGLTLSAVEAVQEHAPLERVGSFACSDQLLNDAWDISCRTLQLCLQGFYEDGVKRDGMLWIGDYRVEFLCAWPVFADKALARRSLEMLAFGQRKDGSIPAVALHAGGHLYPRIPYLGDLTQPGGLHEWTLDNYCADFACSVWEYYLHTGDEATARELLPAVEKVVGYLAGIDPVLAVPGRNFITDNQPESKDWWGSRAALGYQLATACGDAARLFESLGVGAKARASRAAQADHLARTTVRFGDPARATIHDETTTEAARSWHAHAAAFLAGALDAAQLQAVWRELEADPTVRRPMAGFMEFYLLQAWLGAGLMHAALAEMRSYYGQMLRNGATTTWELVDRREPGIDHIHPAGRSHCHGWSAGPAHLLPAYILGITPGAPGYAQILLKPNLGDLDFAHGAVPTPHGLVEMNLEATGHGCVTVPVGLTAKLCLPQQTPVILNGGRHNFRFKPTAIP